MKTPSVVEIKITIKIRNIVLRKLRSISFLFLSIVIFKIAEVIDIKKYPIIKA